MLGTDDPRTLKVFVAPKGAKFRIKPNGGLYVIEMENGGLRPDFTKVKYTSFKQAEMAVERYFENNPKPVARDEKKAE